MYQQERQEQRDRILGTLEQQQIVLTELAEGLRSQYGQHIGAVRQHVAVRGDTQAQVILDEFLSTTEEGAIALEQLKGWLEELTRPKPMVAPGQVMAAYDLFQMSFSGSLAVLNQQILAHAMRANDALLLAEGTYFGTLRDAALAGITEFRKVLEGIVESLEAVGGLHSENPPDGAAA